MTHHDPDPRKLAVRERTLGDEAGFGIVEVLVSALLVVVIGLATLSMLDSATRTASRNEAKGVAAALAQQDQDRLRTMPIAWLGNLLQTRTVEVGGTVFTVRSQGSYVSDAGSTPTCTRAEYVRLSSTVSAPRTDGLEPVRLEGLMHPPLGDGAGGCMAVSVRDREGAAYPGVEVIIAGPASFRQVTEANGTAFFGWTPVGDYTISFPVGLVDQAGDPRPTISGNVVAGQRTSYDQTLDRPGRVDATFESRRSNGTTVVTSSSAVTLEHSGMPGQARTFLADPPPSGTSIAATSLFPFTSPYGIYSGSCTPTLDSTGNRLPATLVSQLPSARYQTTQIVLPSTVHSVRVFEPGLDPVVSVAGELRSGTRVVVTPTGTCAGKSATQLTNSAGKLPDPGFPFGEYTICAQASLGGAIYSHTVTGVRNDQLNGVARSLNVTTDTSTDTARKQAPCALS